MNKLFKYSILASACLSLNVAFAQISDEVVKIGVLTDMNGPYSDASGKGAVEAVKMAVKDFGGEVAGKSIEVVYANHMNKADVASSTARRWYDQDKVDMIIDLNNSAAGLAVTEVAKSKDKVVINAGAGTTALTNENCAPTSFHYNYDSYSNTKAIAQLVRQDLKKWFILSVDYAFGKSMTDTLEKVVKEEGGEIVGKAYHPFNTSDFSSFMLQAQSSGADVVALANATNDTTNAIKSANEFGLADTQTIVPLLIFISDIHSLGLDVAKNMTFITNFYWDRDEETKKWSERFYEKIGKMPTMNQAADYSATLTYLKAIEEIGTDDGLKVAEQMKKMKVEDMFSENGYFLENGRFVHDVYRVTVKSPEESEYDWDYYKDVTSIPGKEAFQPLEESTCEFVK